MDRETLNEYDLIIKVHDNPKTESYRKYNTTHVKIFILDANDNQPEFKSDSIQPINLKETATNGTIMRLLAATDKDQGENGTVYFMAGYSNGNLSSLFTVQKTGELTVSGNLKDRVGTYSFEVLALDKGSPQLNTSVNLTISIIDENNHSPEFLGLPENNIISVYEVKTFILSLSILLL